MGMNAIIPRNSQAGWNSVKPLWLVQRYFRSPGFASRDKTATAGKGFPQLIIFRSRPCDARGNSRCVVLSSRLPRPIPVEPRAGAKFGVGSRVRYKFSWYRKIQENERVSIYVWMSDGSDAFEWRASEADILNGGGAIHEQADGILYEINSGFGQLSKGPAYWKVGIFVDTPTDNSQIGEWSRRRRIVIK